VKRLFVLLDVPAVVVGQTFVKAVMGMQTSRVCIPDPA
jgi:hypothetical protein